MKRSRCFRRTRFDIVLVDLCMTPISGMEILKGALEANADSLVIAMTGNPSVATSVEALRMGALGLPAQAVLRPRTSNFYSTGLPRGARTPG